MSTRQAIFDKKNIVVTGGAGFIGSHLCDELIKTAKVICIDNFSTSSETNIDHLLSEENFEFINHDISQPLSMEELPELEKFKVKFQGIQEIYHLACPTSPKNFDENIIKTLDANSIGTKNILDLAVKYQSKFVHFSSSVVYGPRVSANDYVKESDIGAVDVLSERSSYDEGKRFSETLVGNYQKFFNLDTKILRLFRTYGPRMMLGQGHMIPDFISNALDGKSLVIFGDGEFSSSFCYVSDVVDAAIRAMDSELTGPVNIGSDINIKISKVADIIIKTIGSESEITFSDEHIFITPLTLPYIKRAKEEISWLPVTTLEKGLEATINDLRASKKIKTSKDLLA